jgi:type IV pilus assembly protein PilM
MIKKNYVSIDLGNGYFKVVEGIGSKSEVNISNMFMFQIDETIFNNGYIVDRNKFMEIIKSRLMPKIKSRNLLITLNSSDITIRNITLPNGSDEELKQMLRFEMEELLPIDFNNYVLDFRKVRDIETSNTIEKRVEVQGAVVPNRIPKELFECFSELGFKPLSFNVNNASGFKLLNDVFSDIDYSKKYYTLDIGTRYLGFNVIDDSNMVFNRIIDLSSFNFGENLMKQFNLSKEELIYKLINSIDLKRYTLYYDKVDPNIEYDMEFEKIVVGYVNQVNDELQKTTKYYKTKENSIDVDGIIIYGGNSVIKGIREYIINYFNYDVITYDTYKNIKGFDNNYEFVAFVNAIGNLIKR